MRNRQPVLKGSWREAEPVAASFEGELEETREINGQF